MSIFIGLERIQKEERGEGERKRERERERRIVEEFDGSGRHGASKREDENAIRCHAMNLTYAFART